MTNILYKLILTSLIIAASYNSFAMREPMSSGYDVRVREVVYNADDAVLVNVKSGHASLIQLERGEYITDEKAGIAIGDPDAWDLSVRGNNIFLRPIASEPDTNLNIVSNKRTYVFYLKTVQNAPTWKLKFTYPKTYQAQRNDATTLCSSQGSTNINFNYQKRGKAAFEPKAVWDDGIFTCFRFPLSADLPVIYRVSPDGSEVLVNSHVSGEVVVVHETSGEFRIRLGQQVVALRTGSVQSRNLNSTATTKASIKREVKDA